MKTRGISFLFSTDYKPHLHNLFKGIDLSQYMFYLTDNETLYFNEQTEQADANFFKNGIYTGTQFEKIIKSKEYYIIHIRIFAVPIGEGLDIENIKDYDTFIKSSCEFVLLCADSYADFYAKDENIIKTVLTNCKTNCYENIEIITSENDMRIGFDI